MIKIYKNIIRKLLFVAITISVVTSCDEDDNKYPQLGEEPRTVTEIVSSNPELSSLLQSLQSVGLDSTLDETTTYTLFAPTNSAFNSTDLSGLSDEELEQVLLNHLINTGTADFSANIGTGYLTTMASGPDNTNLSLYINRESGFELNGVANGVSGMLDISGSNGVVHGIDGILMPPTVVDHANGNPSFSMLAEALSLTGLDVTLSGSGTFTLFAPTNGAFQAFMLSVENDLGYASLSEVPVDLLTEILLYHVISDQNILASDAIGPHVSMQGEEFEVASPGDQDGDEVLAKVNDQSEVDANVILADVQATNGVIHGVNKVLLSNSIVQIVKTATLNIVERARDAGYTLFADAVETAGLLDQLTTNSNPLTVFVPTNEALEILLLTGGFTDLSEVDTDPEINALSSLLLYHVIDGFITSNVLVGEIPTLQGETIEVITGDPIRIQDKFDTPANIVTPDITATNGIIHIVDDILASDDAINDFGLNVITPPILGYSIYQEGPIKAGWSSGGWNSTIDYSSAAQKLTGSTSMAIDFGLNTWSAGNYQADAAVDITGYDVLKVSIYTPESGQQARIALNGQFNDTDPHQTFRPLNPGWNTFEIPLSDIGSPTEFTAFGIQYSGSGVIYVDDVGFDSSYGYEVYNEGPIKAGWSSGGWNSTIDYSATDEVFLGSTSMAIDYGTNTWSAGNYQADAAVDISGYTTLKVSIFTPESGQQARIALNGQFNDTDPHQTFRPLNPGWNTFEIPFSDIGSPTEFTAFGIQYSGSGIIYVDAVGFN